MTITTEERDTRERQTREGPAARQSIDPRIRERRIEVIRAAGRRRLRITLVIASTIVVIGLGYLGIRSPLLDVDHIRITGTRREPSSEILRAARVHKGDALLLVGTGAIAHRLEQLPWVAHARVSRDFPGTLKIAITEFVPTAYVRIGPNQVALVASTGRVIANAPAPPPGAIEVIGQHVTPAVGSLLSPPEVANVVGQLPRRLATQIVAIDLSRPNVALRLRTPSGAAAGSEPEQVRLGSLDDLGDKGAAALAVLDHLAGRTCSYVDVAAPQAPVSRCS